MMQVTSKVMKNPNSLNNSTLHTSSIYVPSSPSGPIGDWARHLTGQIEWVSPSGTHVSFFVTLAIVHHVADAYICQ
jgi:hypothetical protein